MKSHLESYPCPLIINSFWNLGFLLGITILLQIITGIFLSLYYISDINSTYFSIFFLIREIYYGWYLRYLHSNGASFVFLFIFLHFGRGISYASSFGIAFDWLMQKLRKEKLLPDGPSVQRQELYFPLKTVVGTVSKIE